ncbi:CsbD family protein [Jiulongibacter sediminis]|uniref:General stress protein CsbD n=1 Tax=Jiulongibacter sediminis TaxID=1605367 RepID=A0A0P7CA55_9BACT|nr:CsbD family protein [Jiulongibacter sediminis]KPM49473.1 general stress protein CsbD [Jiulongibacter sediminis]TBX26520.1 general stress protein CsbD [Jiulongibacter sediminis]
MENAITDKIKGNWNQIKGQLQQKWGNLTDDDLQYEEGQENELLGILQEKTGETKQNLKNFIDKI